MASAAATALAQYLLSPSGDRDPGGDAHFVSRRRSVRAPAHESTVDDATIVAGLRANDGAAYEHAIRAYYAWLHSVAMSYVASEVIAEELVDGAFTRTWERRTLLAPDTKLATYLFVSVRHSALNHLKHEVTARRRLQLSQAADTPPGMGGATPSPDVVAEQREVTEAVWRAVDTLSERARAILLLRWQKQLDWDEVADALGMSSAAVQMQHSRSLKLLRERLPEYLTKR